MNDKKHMKTIPPKVKDNPSQRKYLIVIDPVLSKGSDEEGLEIMGMADTLPDAEVFVKDQMRDSIHSWREFSVGMHHNFCTPHRIYELVETITGTVRISATLKVETEKFDG